MNRLFSFSYTPGTSFCNRAYEWPDLSVSLLLQAVTTAKSMVRMRILLSMAVSFYFMISNSLINTSVVPSSNVTSARNSQVPGSANTCSSPSSVVPFSFQVIV